MGGIFSIGECAAQGIREKEDPVNAAIGGCAAGLLAGIKSEYDKYTCGRGYLCCII
jgi:hypothetical protein